MLIDALFILIMILYLQRKSAVRTIDLGNQGIDFTEDYISVRALLTDDPSVALFCMVFPCQPISFACLPFMGTVLGVVLPLPAQGREYYPAPTTAVPETQLGVPKQKSGVAALTTLYAFGNPSAEEQLQLELLNRARMAPAAEGNILAGLTDPDIVDYYNYYKVNFTVMKAELAALAATPPLAPNQLLTNAARSHSQWMLTNGLQAHDQIPNGPGGDSTERITASGYTWISAGENLYAYSLSPLFGHAGFEVDWGIGANGMQSPRGHRINDHSSSFREIGVGIVNGTAKGMGPQLLTQDFGQAANSPVFLTGVAYFDLNGNNFYDLGEALSGVTVASTGSTFHCLTAAGGGWALPFPRASGSRTVTFTGPHLTQATSGTINASLDNVKLDLKLSYTAPVFTSASQGYAGLPATVTFTAVPGISSYRFTAYAKAAAPAENCENATKVTPTISAGYALVDPNVRQQGSASFHLAMPDGYDQFVELNSLYAAGTAPGITFQSLLGWATADQTAQVEVKEEGTPNWVPVFAQNGNDQQGEILWKTRNANLTGWAGKYFRVRLRYAVVPGGPYFPDVDNASGWFVDALQFADIAALTPASVSTLSTESTTYTAAAAGVYTFRCEPLNAGVSLPSGWQTFTAQGLSAYMTWARGYETAKGLPPGKIALAPTADFDSDGRANLYEYALGSSPTQVLAAPGPQLRATATTANFDYVKNTALTDVTVRPEISLDQFIWKSPGQAGAPVGFTDSLVSTNGNLQTRRASIPLSGVQRAFFRLAVRLN
jgi:hypothetical protein